MLVSGCYLLGIVFVTIRQLVVCKGDANVSTNSAAVHRLVVKLKSTIQMETKTRSLESRSYTFMKHVSSKT